jgi:nitric oxide reductase activation protein
VAAAFLLDMSASTDIPVPDPAAAPAAGQPQPHDDDPYLHSGLWPGADIEPATKRRRVIDVARESLALMCDALATLGDAWAIYGFSGEGRENVEFHVAKDFGDRLSSRTWAALAAMQPQRSTRMGPAIRHALEKLRRQAARMKVLIVVSDGYPQDSDYGPDRNDEEYGIQDTARALQQAERAGVQTFCITIDPAGHDYLRRMCSPNRYLVIDEVADLPGELSKVYRALTV